MSVLSACVGIAGEIVRLSVAIGLGVLALLLLVLLPGTIAHASFGFHLIGRTAALSPDGKIAYLEDTMMGGAGSWGYGMLVSAPSPAMRAPEDDVSVDIYAFHDPRARWLGPRRIRFCVPEGKDVRSIQVMVPVKGAAPEKVQVDFALCHDEPGAA
jgi:hypothetical protein